MIELKPCPFCGREAKVCGFHYSLHGKGDMEKFYVICNSCSASSYPYAIKPEKAIEAWNRRNDNEAD